MPSDRIYSLALEHVGDFVFDERVVEVFPDMIARSVPGYASIIAMTVELAEHYATPRSNIYDLGCSLGAATLPMSERVPRDCVIYAVDSSAAMIKELEAKQAQKSDACSVKVAHADVLYTPMHTASFIVMNFTLQFIAPEARTALLNRIHAALLPGGALVLSEKICFEKPQQQELFTTLHHAFKRANGYSDLEIAQKRTALENTLLPETLDLHLSRLEEAGFRTPSAWFQCLNFASIIAVK